MSEAAIVLWVIGFVVFTLNVALICDTAEKIAKMRYKEADPEEQVDNIAQ